MHQLPLSSVFRFFFNEMVTSVLMTGASLTRSLAFSVDTFDMIGADTGRAIELVDVKSGDGKRIGIGTISNGIGNEQNLLLILLWLVEFVSTVGVADADAGVAVASSNLNCECQEKENVLEPTLSDEIGMVCVSTLV